MEADQEYVSPFPIVPNVLLSDPVLEQRLSSAAAGLETNWSCAELKDTHLGPLSAFSRSPSTSTITDRDEKGTSPGATTPTSESATGKLPATDAF